MRIAVSNRQTGIRLDLPWLRSFARRALKECQAVQMPPDCALRMLDAVEVAVVSDAMISDLHRRFMKIEGPTDVLTFEHGEIIISVDTGKANAAAYGKTLEEELGLYIIHGMLHLGGFTDAEPAAADGMARAQDRILRSCLANGDGTKT